MCGRLNITDNEALDTLMSLLGIPLRREHLNPPSYNVAPSAALFALTHARDEFHQGKIHWGFTPSWAKPEHFKRPLINARAESVWEKASFREAIRQRRLVVPIIGFYEWRRDESGRQPFYFHPSEQPALALAGIWERDPQGVPGCSLLTTAANGDMAPVHHRMPVLLPPEAVGDWLCSSDPRQLDSLMQPAPRGSLTAIAVVDAVNNARHDSARCIEPLTE